MRLTLRGTDIVHKNWLPVMIMHHGRLVRKCRLVTIVEPGECSHQAVQDMPTQALRDFPFKLISIACQLSCGVYTNAGGSPSSGQRSLLRVPLLQYSQTA